MVLARHFTHSDFERYIAAIATLGLLATFSEAGFGKYALRIVPVYLNMQNGHLLRSYVRFALAATLWLSLAVVAAAAFVEWLLRQGEDEYVILVAITILPIVALAGVVVDLLLALGLATWGMFVGRILVPATTLALIVWLIKVTTVTPLQAVYCFAGGSVTGLVLGLLLCAWRTPKSKSGETLEAPATNVWLPWAAASFSFMTFYFLLAWLSRSTLFIASHLPHQQHQLAVLAPAIETGCLILLLSKSTDKYFQPSMSWLLESTQWQHLIALERARRKIIGSCVAIFLIGVFLFGKSILRIYGEDFVPGYSALCVVAVGSSVWTMFSLSPSFLLYSGGSRILMILLCIHAVLLVILMVVLFPTFGALGGALAYTLTVSAFTLTNLSVAHSRLGRLAAEPNGANRLTKQTNDRSAATQNFPPR